MNSSKLDQAAAMARNGKTIVTIHKELDLDYWEVWDYVRNSQGTKFSSWHGAKWIITHRLNRLVNEKDQAKRQQLRNQAAECVNYLYSEAKRLSRKNEAARRILE